MRKVLPRGITIWATASALHLVACGPKSESKSPDPKTQSAKEKELAGSAKDGVLDPEPALWKPFVGEQKVVQGEPLEASVEFFGSFEGKRVLSLRLPNEWDRQAVLARAEGDDDFYPAIETVLVDSPKARVAFFLRQDRDPTEREMRSSSGPQPPRDLVWLLVDEEDLPALKPSLLVNFNSEDPEVRVVKLPLRFAKDRASSRGDAEATWGRALIRDFKQRQSTPFVRASLSRLHRLYGSSEGRKLSRPTGVPIFSSSGSDLSDLMSLSSGARSVELALERRRTLSVKERGRTDIRKFSALSPPSPRRHDWAHMLKGLQAQRALPELSRGVPADFYFIHATRGESLFLFLDQLDTFLTPAAHLVEEDTSYYGISKRYLTMLGLTRGPLTRALGPKVIREVAIVGSDPFLRMGSDLTVIFEAHNPKLLALGLAGSLERLKKGHPHLSVTQVEIAGRSLRHIASKDGAIQQFFLQEESRLHLSNSREALERVLLAQDGKAPRLSDEPDFRYMVSRDEGAGTDILAYAGDSFIESAVSPRSRILDARRALALGELRHLSRAGLLRGLLGRKVETDPKLLLSEKLLLPHEARHFDKSKISAGPKSEWGTPSQMRPLIEGPDLKWVTAAEASAYKEFVRSYDRAWSDKMDPIALRLKLNKDGEGLEAQLRVLPLSNDSEYRKIQRLVGETRLEFRGPALGMQLLVALSKDSELRSLLTHFSSKIIGKKDAFAWLGDYVFVGAEDRNELANALSSELAPDRGMHEIVSAKKRIGQMPLYAGVAISSRIGADIALSALKVFSESMNDITWHKSKPYAGSMIESVEFPRSGFRLYFSLAKETIFFSVRESTIKKLLDLEEAGKLPVGTKEGRAQWGLETRQRPGGALATLLTWAYEDEWRKWTGPQNRAEALAMAWRGAGAATSGQLDSQELMTLLGRLPTTRDGFFFEMGQSGAFDGQRWTGAQRKWPSLPVAGSYVDSVLARLKWARFEMSFDPEAPDASGNQESSLSIRVLVERE